MPKKSKSPKAMSPDKFVNELLGIFEGKLSSLPTAEQDARIDAFHAKATKGARGICATTSQPQETHASPLLARSGE